jgi:hypothetical protein
VEPDRDRFLYQGHVENPKHFEERIGKANREIQISCFFPICRKNKNRFPLRVPGVSSLGDPAPLGQAFLVRRWSAALAHA